jgi:soluble lytic murein transglycosylase-like protein
MKRLFAACLLGIACLPGAALAGAQKYETLADSVVTRLSHLVSDKAVAPLQFSATPEARRWLEAMDARLARRMPDRQQRLALLRTVHYEATRAGLDPQLVLGVIEVESAFRKYAVSRAGARGYMQVMPFWTKVLRAPNSNLFHLRTNLAFGCTILRHYLTEEKGDLFRALGRYNGSLGQAEYPNQVLAAWHGRWKYEFAPPA